MKVVKPLGLGAMHRTFEYGGRCRLVVTVVGFFSLDAPDLLLPEIGLWKMVPDALGEGGILDEWMLKPRGEVLVSGKAYAPEGRPQTVGAVRLRLGSVDKRLFVVGDRFWDGSKASEPVPFTEMPVAWTHAFGGPGYELNPIGRGYGPSQLEDGTSVQLLPNVEDPAHAVAGPGDRPRPAGFDAYDLTWPQRFRKVGTYDHRWLEKLYPGLAEDIDWTFFNRAPEDQWLPAHFRGDETFSIEGMHPQRPVIESRLPAVSARCFVVKAADESQRLHEVPLHIDTLHVFPNCLRGVVLFRGAVEVVEDDAADIAVLVAAAEVPGEPRALEHYQAVLLQRLDREKGHLYALRDSDLMPPRAPGQKSSAEELMGDMQVLLQRDGLLEQRMRARAVHEHEKLRQRCRDNGVDPDEHLPPLVLPEPESAPPLDELAQYVEAKTTEAEQARQDTEKQRELAMAKARAACEEAGVDFDAVMADAAKQGGGPPTFSARMVLEDLREQSKLASNVGITLPIVEQRLADADLPASLDRMEAHLKDLYRRFAHYLPEATSPEVERTIHLRVRLQASVDAGEPLVDRDFTGADLSGMNLRGADLHGAFLEKADLTDADLTGANLSDCVLARATLAGAVLEGADLRRANLGNATLPKASLRGADLSEAVLTKANLSHADLADAKLDKATLMEARCSGACFEGVVAPELMFVRVDLSGVRLARATLRKGILFECALAGADLTGANLEAAVLVTAAADGACFERAEATNLRVLHGTSLNGAVFRGAKLVGSNFRGTKLADADFSGAQLDNADLSECDLQRASFVRASAKQAALVRADLRGAKLVDVNLMMGLLQKANIEGADFTGANLFRADLARIKGNRGTRFDDANMKQIRFVERSDDGQS